MGGPCKFSEAPLVNCLSPATLAVIQALGFERATPVQEAVIPLFCGNKDVAVDACTGSGKTLAFIVPIIEKLRRLEDPLRRHQVGAIVVSPTRELSRQIFNVAQPFVDSVPGLTVQLLVGGTDPALDVAQFKETGAHLLVGTPGRIDDIMKRCAAMELKRLEALVLDEADRLLDMGFRVQLDAIMARLPKQRRTGLFSATQTEAVQALARAGLRNPVRVNVAVTAHAPIKAAAPGAQHADSTPATAEAGAVQKTPAGLQISFVVTDVDQKMSQLVRFLQLHGTEKKIIVYALTCACVDFYSVALKRLGPTLLKGVQIKSLHGRMKQSAREATLEAFTQLPAGVLLATDLAARGLDIPEVHWVVQMDPPQDPAAFVHRVGRTARAGRAGAAIAYLTPHESAYVELLRLRKVPLTESLPFIDAPDVLPLLRAEAGADREVMEAGMKAFVSYVRGYKEHHCRFIFRIQDLPIGRLATSFALLRLPHMPEVKKALVRGGTGPPTCEHFVPSEVDPDTVKFKDRTREKQRKQMLKQRAAAALAEGAKEPVPSSKRAAPGPAAAPQAGARLTATKRRQLQAQDEMEDLATEYKLLKKLKRGKMSEHDFDVATGLESEDEEVEKPAAKGGPGQQGRAATAGVKRKSRDSSDVADGVEKDHGEGQQGPAEQTGAAAGQLLPDRLLQGKGVQGQQPAARPKQSRGTPAQQAAAHLQASRGAPADGGLQSKAAKLRGQAPTRVQQKQDAKVKRKLRRVAKEKGKQ